jgi:hypothetical protein
MTLLIRLRHLQGGVSHWKTDALEDLRRRAMTEILVDQPQRFH